MIHLLAMLGVVTGYYSGQNLQVLYETNYAIIEDNYLTYNFSIIYNVPNSTTARYVINSPDILQRVPTDSEHNKPYGCVVALEFDTLGTSNNGSYQEYTYHITAYYDWYYYDGSNQTNTNIITMSGEFPDYYGDNRLLDRAEYTGTPKIKFTIVDTELLEDYAYGEGLTNGLETGRNEGNGVNNVISWFGNVWDALTNFLSLEIAPNIRIATLVTIPIVIGVLFFVLKALIQ